MTGRAAGFCAGVSVPENVNPMVGRGCGMGYGRGFGGGGRGLGGGKRGWRNRFQATGLTQWQQAAGGFVPTAVVAPTADQQLAALKNQAEFVENELGAIKSRIAELIKAE